MKHLELSFIGGGKVKTVKLLWKTVRQFVAKSLKNIPAIQETQVQFLGWEEPLEKEMATYSSIFAWRLPGTEEPGRLYSPWGHKSQMQLSD